MWRVISLGVVAAGTVLFIALLVFLHRPVVDAGEDGIFANDCCGTVKLADGEMLLNDQQTISYSVARDADGPYILPRFDVGVVSDQGLDVDGTRSVRKLRLDRLPAATKLTLHEGLTPYVFKRLTPHLRHIRGGASLSSEPKSRPNPMPRPAVANRRNGSNTLS